MRAFDSDLSFGTKRPHVLVTASQACSRFFLNRYFFLFLFCIACGVVVTSNEVSGAVLFVGIICIALILCEDILATTLPFLLLCVFLTRCYDSYDIFIQYAWMAVPAVFAILFHFTVYRRKIQIGNTFWGLIAVSLALMLGGVGFISSAEYFRPGTLYYTVFLGIGMVVAYLLLKSQMCVERGYSVREKFVALLYIMGIFACFLILFFISENMESIRETKALPELQASNNLCTLLMFALPCPFFFVPRNRLHLLAPVLMLFCMILTGSRGGVLLGAAEIILCLLVTAYWDKPRRFFYICCTVGFLGFVLLKGEDILQFSTQKNWNDLILQNEARYQLIFRAKNLFLQNPVFGHGLGYTGNTDLYNPVKGAMEWYHMMIPQIVGSLGIVGILAYGFQFVLRIRALLLPIFQAPWEQRGLVLTMALSYGGVLLMSQLNPGLFCPLPYSLLAVMIFALLDGNNGLAFLSSAKKHH